MESLNRSENARKMVREYGIILTPRQEQYVIAHPFTPDVFPVAVGDDGGIVYYQCEVPITRKGDLILVGHRYETWQEDSVLVKSMELKRYWHQFRWNITVIDSFGDEEELMVWEFKTICF
ncbi:hypothetical protein [Nostoc sp. FACHB-110]|uniref:hypothetical protein n=1 Tax=Nostoc sp. FACHB-110 TaxID=2692834 RepID=UPI0016823F0C|nr:hypothetical protein [Nostoc sp. FACHB-110]MBD2441169.1 hypothetical protein [Nostoc sp. FACHB-110]